MSFININEIKIYEDQVKEYDILKQIIATRDQEDAFYILDLGDVIKKHRNWLKNMPRVVPHFAVKCNPDPMVIKILAAMNASFDCASQQEIEQVMQYGVTPDKIIFANPTKSPSHIKFAKSVGVDKMTVDNELELFKIKNLFPEAKIIIRFRCDSNSNLTQFINLGIKFGCDPGDEANKLIQFSKNLGLTLHGFSFHVGSPCNDFNAYTYGIEICKQLITFAKSIGCKDIKLVDIGGGFPGESEFQIDELSNVINEAIEKLDPGIEVMSEPGRYYVASAFTLTSYLHSKRSITDENGPRYMYFANCGVYSGFIEELLNLCSRHPISLFGPVSDKKYPSTLWGPTLDSYDCIIKDALLPEFQIGDWLVWSNMGAYTASLAFKFNGFEPPVVYPFIRKSQWKEFCDITRYNMNCWLCKLE